MSDHQRLFAERLDGLRVEEGSTFGLGGHLVTAFPLRGDRQGSLDYALLEEALAADTLDVRELEQPAVGAVQAINRGDRPVLITDGDTLTGGQQNRVVNSSVLVPPGRLVLPVSCVERGRWHPDAIAFAASEIAYPALRMAKSAHVGASLRDSGHHVADQGQIWEEIAGRQAAGAVASPTESMPDLYEHRRDRLVAYARALPCPRDAVGVIFGYGGRVVSMEMFDAPDTLLRFWHRLVRAAALDALAQKPDVAVSLSRAVRMLNRAKKADCAPFPSPGLGEDVRVAGAGVEGAALMLRSIAVHAALYRVPTHG